MLRYGPQRRSNLGPTALAQRPIEIEHSAGQFAPLADPLAIAIPREEILAEAVAIGERAALDAVCLAVAVALEALTQAAIPES